MRKESKVLSVFLCVTLLFLSTIVGNISAETSKWRITGDGVRLRAEPTTKSDEVTSFAVGTLVAVNGSVEGQEVSPGNKIWYNVTYGDKIGYVYSKYVEEIKPAEYDTDFETNLLNFPQSYREPLRSIHNIYPNWKFVADNMDISLEEAINLEYSAENLTKTRKWVELTYGIEWRDERVQTDEKGNVIADHICESRWTYASKKAISYFMDPRNALTVTNTKYSFPNIFTFLQQSYDARTQDASGLRTVIKGTFLENGYDGDSDAYIKDIMAAAEESKVSPYVIASTIITEQGTKGTSSLISGTYEGYEGYYNFFNYGASGENVIANGLQYAKSQEWNSRRASIIGGAKKYESGYLGSNQDTYYYMDFNVKYPDRIWHQYANNLYDQCVKATSMGKSYINNTSSALTFKIPVYTSMADTVYAAPTIEEYAQTTPEPRVPARKKGDVSGDGEITVKDFAEIRMHLLGVKTLSGEDLAAADVNSDGSVTVKDFAMVRMYLLGLISISQKEN